jgi:hypothetical protein|tara:strand:- start:89 stop:253 length:165 start_codon:yes stop_codon:yes gene_type:complete
MIMSIKNDKLVGRKDWQGCEIHFSLVLESPDASKNEKEKKIDEMDSTISSLFIS